jgi:hypothetical protein
MALQYLKEQNQKLKDTGAFYSPNGIHIYIKDPIHGPVNLSSVIEDYENILPPQTRENVEMIVVGHFDEFLERKINAFYENGSLFVSNIQTSNEDLLDDLVHETAHSIEEVYGYELYADQLMKDEFIQKRKFLYDMLWKMGFKAPLEVFLDPEYNKEFDKFLFMDVGYDKLSEIMKGVFITPYAATSLREYFATLFTEFYLYPDSHGFLSRVSPAPYKKIMDLHRQENA